MRHAGAFVLLDPATRGAVCGKEVCPREGTSRSGDFIQ